MRPRRQAAASASVTFGLLAFAACGGGGETDDADSDDLDETVTIGSNDVSILMPLPTIEAEIDDLLALSDPAVDGPLLPEAIFDQLAATLDSPQAYAMLRVVALRIDPCFPSLSLLETNPAACRRQLRLVVQPLEPDPVLGAIAADETYHLFYDLDDATFGELAASLVALGTDATSSAATPLGVHPTITAEGLDGPTALAVRELVLGNAGPARLTQITNMQGFGVFWRFKGVTVSGGVLTPIVIDGLPDDATGQTNGADNLGVFDISPASATATQLQAALAGTFIPDGGVGGGTVELQAPVGEIVAALQLSLDIDNPERGFDPESLDCVTCHVASRARVRAAGLGFPSDELVAFTNPRDLSVVEEPAGDSAPMAMRMFGYDLTVPVLNQRVVNESAAVADAIEALLGQ